MKRRHGYTYLEQLFAVSLVGMVMAILMPAMVSLTTGSADEQYKMSRLSNLNRVCERMSRDLRAAAEVYVRGAGDGFVLRVPQGDSEYFVSYRIGETEPGVLYRCRFHGQDRDFTRELSGVAQMTVTPAEDSRLVRVDISLTPIKSGMAGLQRQFVVSRRPAPVEEKP